MQTEQMVEAASDARRIQNSRGENDVSSRAQHEARKAPRLGGLMTAFQGAANGFVVFIARQREQSLPLILAAAGQRHLARGALLFRFQKNLLSSAGSCLLYTSPSPRDA